jgi:CTP synthase
VIQALDVKDVYEVPLMFNQQGLDRIIVRLLGLSSAQEDLVGWRTQVVERALRPGKTTRIAVVGKYTQLQDAYKSLDEALRHGGLANDARVEIKKVDAELLTTEGAETHLADVRGILIPGGFGHRGIEGKLQAITFARERGIPFLGICLGMQCAVIEFARNVLGLAGANSTEFDAKTPHPVISLLEEQSRISELGGTMRLGASTCHVIKGTKTYEAYRRAEVTERHRHRYEFNNSYRDSFLKHGMVVSGVYKQGETELVELIELNTHSWFVAGQFHPEFKSRPLEPHPLFRAFVQASLQKQ